MTNAEPRDYRKFLGANGVLDPSLLPRDVYVTMVFELRDTTDEVVGALRDAFLGYDLDRLIERVREEEGLELAPDDAARRLFGTLDERAWWDATEALERRLQRLFAADPRRWAAHVDPVYDRQEREGWRRLS
jgi:hypothetical protein